MAVEIALVDDHHLVRSALAGMLGMLGDYRIAIEAGNGRELLEALAGRETIPPIAIIDLNMPVMDGYETVARLKDRFPEVCSLVLTFDASESAMMRAIHAGARGFLPKHAHPDELRDALQSLLLTGYYHTEAVNAQLLSAQRGELPDEARRQRILASITPREMEFLAMACSPEEYTYERMAEAMGVHRRTVDNFRAQLFEKLGVKSRTGLVLAALRWRLLP
jgi:DNA-binding NarL/FixJ family response regulator